jgi:hypothetical protein
MDEVAGIINQHTMDARNALQRLPADIDRQLFEGWLNNLETAADSALQGRDQALEFLKAYGGDHAIA